MNLARSLGAIKKAPTRVTTINARNPKPMLTPQSFLRQFLMFIALYTFIGLCFVGIWHGLNLYFGGTIASTLNAKTLASRR
jgi:hypothetical protein